VTKESDACRSRHRSPWPLRRSCSRVRKWQYE
jgi:hypothetical protein